MLHISVNYTSIYAHVPNHQSYFGCVSVYYYSAGSCTMLFSYHCAGVDMRFSVLLFVAWYVVNAYSVGKELHIYTHGGFLCRILRANTVMFMNVIYLYECTHSMHKCSIIINIPAEPVFGCVN